MSETDPTVGKGPGFLMSVVTIAGLFNAVFVVAALSGAIYWWTAVADVFGVSGAAAVVVLRAQWAAKP